MMDQAGWWSLIDRAWQRVDGGALIAALARSQRPPVAELEAKVARLLAILGEQLDARFLDDARGAIEQLRAAIGTLDPPAIASGVGAWMYDHTGAAVTVVALLGEAYHHRVSGDPDCARLLSGAAGLEQIGGWRALAVPVRERWRAALLARIPERFADVPYPGDAAVSSGDWATSEECRWFCGQDWRDVDRRAVHRRYADLVFFEPAGFHYLLPAFLMAALEDVDGSEVRGLPITEQLVYMTSSKHGRRRLALLSPGQRDLLAEVLRFSHDDWTRGPLAWPDRDRDAALAWLTSSGA